ncbi:cell envelope biogenesis protein TolA, partial [Escherichia coli]
MEIFFALQCEGNFFDGGYMSEVTDLVVIEKANAMTVFQSADQIEEIL